MLLVFSISSNSVALFFRSFKKAGIKVSSSEDKLVASCDVVDDKLFNLRMFSSIHSLEAST